MIVVLVVVSHCDGISIFLLVLHSTLIWAPVQGAEIESLLGNNQINKNKVGIPLANVWSMDDDIIMNMKTKR